MMRLSRYEQAEQAHREHLEMCGIESPGRTEFDDEHDAWIAAQDRARDKALPPLPDCTCGRGTASRYEKHPGHRYHCPRYERVPWSREAA